MNKSILTPIRLFFKVSSHIAPFIAIRLANKLFTTPFHSKRRDIEHEMLESVERFTIPMGKNIKLAGYRWGKKTDPIILLVHGWTGTATSFVNFIDPLLERGYQVVSYDAIAHGETSGISVSLTEWADTVVAVMEHIGKVYCIIGHSLGAGAIVIASSLKLETEKIVLISPMSDLSKVTDQFAEALSIPKKIMEKTHQYAWKKYYTSASKYGNDWKGVFESEIKLPALIIHDLNDKEIDISHSRKLLEQWSSAEFMETKRLGHKRIILNPDVITRVLGFITGITHRVIYLLLSPYQQRQGNKMFYKIIKYPFFGRFMVKWKNPLSEDERKQWKKISIKSKSGGVIHGLFAKSKTNEEKATVVLGHPMGKEAKGYFLKRGYTELLRNNGFNVVIFDINGFGESTHGSFSYFEDIIAIGIKAKEITPKLPIAYHGISLGASWATISFADEAHVYDFAIIESASTSLLEFWVLFPVAYRTLQFINAIMPNYRKKVEMIERMKEAKHLQSILFIYSERDRWTPLEMGKRFKQNSPVQTELWTVKNAKHAEIILSPSKE